MHVYILTNKYRTLKLLSLRNSQRYRILIQNSFYEDSILGSLPSDWKKKSIWAKSHLSSIAYCIRMQPSLSWFWNIWHFVQQVMLLFAMQSQLFSFHEFFHPIRLTQWLNSSKNIIPSVFVLWGRNITLTSTMLLPLILWFVFLLEISKEHEVLFKCPWSLDKHGMKRN